MTHPSPLAYDGHIITERGEMLSLTDMWKTAGEPENKRPAEWIRYEGASFIQFVAETHNVGIAHIIKGQRGKGGSTFAHWQVGIAYAKYLDHGFHMWANIAVREKMEGKAPSLPADAAALIARTDGIVRQMHHKVTVMERNSAELTARIGELENKVSSSTTCTAADIWAHYSFGPLKAGTLWLGNRLIELGCMPEFGGREINGRRRFDIAKSHLAMKNGLKLLTERHIAERRGQGVLRLVQNE